MAERQRILAGRKEFNVDVNAAGKFERRGVPLGTYSLEGKRTKKYGRQIYEFDVSTQVEIANEDDIDFGEILIRARREVQIGERFPNFELPVFGENQTKITNKNLDGKFALVYFWGTERELSSLELESVVALRKKLAKESAEIVFLGVCQNKKKEIDPQFLEYRKLDLEAWSGGPDSIACELFGVSNLPTYCLIDAEGKVVANDRICKQLFQKSSLNIEAIVRAALAGKDLEQILNNATKAMAK